MNAKVGFWLAADAAPTFAALDLDADALASVARRRLTQLLVHASLHNRFYARRLQERGIGWADPIIQDDPYRALALLPVVSKVELRGAGTKALDRGRVGVDWLSSASSGSTGEPFRVYYEPRAWAQLKHLVKLRARRACGVGLTDRVALLEAIPAQQSFQPGRWARISVLQPAPEIARDITAYSPSVLYGLPSALLEAARELERKRKRLRIRAVFTSGELLDRATRETLTDIYGAAVYNVYGTSETKEIAWECIRGGMHVNADVVHVEVLDELGRAAAPGEEGELVVTSLVNRAMPLLRYRTGDRGSLRTGSCPCGRSSPLMGVVAGRTADVLVLRGGHRISPYALTCAMERVAGVLRYQVSQIDPARVRVRAMLEAAADRQLVAAQVRDALRYEVAPFLESDVEFVDRFPAGPRAKFRVVEPLHWTNASDGQSPSPRTLEIS